jgi:hypothetical protein
VEAFVFQGSGSLSLPLTALCFRRSEFDPLSKLTNHLASETAAAHPRSKLQGIHFKINH